MATRILRSLPDLVKVSPGTVAATTGAGNWGPDAGNAYREYISLVHEARIQKDGYITQIKVAGPTDLTGQAFYFRVWRRPETRSWRLVGQTGDLIGQVTANAVSTITLPDPIYAEEGDYIGYRLDGAGTTNWHTVALSACNNCYVNATTPRQVGFDWLAQNVTLDVILPIEVYMTAPTLVCIGNSIISGYSTNRSFIEAGENTNLPSSISYNLRSTFPTVVNHGIGGQTAAQIAARFQTDVVDMKPRYVLIEGGVNDLGAVTTVNQVLASYTTMLDLCAANGIIGVVLLILPYTNGTNAAMQKRDQINAGLVSLVAGYSGFRVADAGSAVGVFRAGGDANNLWDIAAAYSDGSGVHFNSAGYAAIANVIAAAVTA